MNRVSPNSRRLFSKLAFWVITIANIDGLFESQGFQRSDRDDPESSRRREGRVAQYHAAVDWDDDDQVRRVLAVYQAAIDEYGHLPGGALSPQARNLLRSLERDGNLVLDDEIYIPEPEIELEGPLEGITGWDDVDSETTKLRRQYAAAVEAHDFNAVGLRCLRVLGAVAEVVFDERSHVPSGVKTPGPADVKARIEYFLSAAARGDRFENLRKLVRAAYAQANTAKHRETADRIDAGVAVAATLMLVESLRLVADLD